MRIMKRRVKRSIDDMLSLAFARAISRAEDALMFPKPHGYVRPGWLGTPSPFSPKDIFSRYQ